MQELRNVQTKHIDYRCHKCQHGWMRPTGIVLDTHPPTFPHKCTHCGNEETLNIRYPHIISE